MFLATVYDMDARNGSQGIKAGGYFRNHAAANHALLNELLGFGLGQLRDERPIVAINAHHVAQEDEFLGVEGARDMSSHQIGVDIETGAIGTLAQRSDDGDEPFVNYRLDERRVNRLDLANKAQPRIGDARPYQIAIGPAQPGRFPS